MWAKPTTPRGSGGMPPPGNILNFTLSEIDSGAIWVCNTMQLSIIITYDNRGLAKFMVRKSEGLWLVRLVTYHRNLTVAGAHLAGQ